MQIIRLLSALLLAIGGAGIAQAANPDQFDQRVAVIRAKMMTDPGQTLIDARSLPALIPPDALPITRTHLAATADWFQAEALIRLNRPAEAQRLIHDALQAMAGVDPDPGLRGELILARGGVASSLGRVEDALRDNQEAFRLLGRAGNSRGQAIALQAIGSIYSDAHDYANAIKYFRQSIDVYAGDASLSLSAYNNIGNALFELKRYPAASIAFSQALKIARLSGGPLLQAQILRNLVATQAEAGQFGQARANLAEAFRISANGPSASSRAALYAVAARLALRQHDLNRAHSLIMQAFSAAAGAEANLPMRDFHQTAYEIFRQQGDGAAALAHLEAFQKLDDQARTLAASTSAALMNARFNFTNQELRIRNLRAEQEQARARFRNRMQLALLSAAAVISTLLLIGFLSIRRSRNQVREANTSLLTTNVALEKALAAKTEFLATTSHEIRTPLNGILGMTQVILAGRQLDPTLRGRIELVQGAGETMKALVDDILDVAKMETGELRIQTAEMDLKRLLEDAVTVWTGQAETKRIGIEFDLEHCPGKIIADEVRLRQIIFNLMSNAIKFTDRGQVRLAAFFSETDDESESERLVIRVADSGIGIPQDRIEEIFESFRQVDGGVTRRHGGTGLGLAICRNLARAMGGDVTVASTLGAGSTFTLTLPLERGTAEVAPADRVAATSLGTANLLMIEPNPLGQGIMRALLTGECGSVQFTTEVGQALDALKTGAIDHVIAEGSALGLDPQGAGELAAACADAKARFTLLWREPTSELLGEFAKEGVTHVVAKPISAPDLLSEMNKVYGEPIASRNIAA
jgi:signal transduction histidine kinase/CheY-like chemotaxis protein